MEIFKSHPQWNDVKKICGRLREQGFTAWLAGGCVRDGLMGEVPKDFDIATNARPKKVESLFNKTVNVGKAFGVIKVVVPSGDIEVATFRRDGNYTDGRRPDSVELATPQEDAKRRDFTINALFYDIFDGEVRDYVDGIKDIQKRLVRTVGLPQDRFMEDKLRILRAIRFVAQLDFDLDQTTYDAVCLLNHSVTQVSWERISDELTKLIQGKKPGRGLKLLRDSGLLDVLFPEMAFDPKAIDWFAALPGEKNKKLLGWIFLISLITDVDQHDKTCRKLRFSGDFMEDIKSGLEIATSLRIFDRLGAPEKRKIAAEPLIDTAIRYLELKGEMSALVKAFIAQNRTLPKPFVEAADILSLGITPGPQVGKLLEEAFDAQLEGKVQNRGAAMAWLKSKTQQKPSP
jgi:tRNA nucleotidyltransferase/poly(A) polymerase